MSTNSFTARLPEKSGCYVWKGFGGDYALVLVDRRPTEHEPGGQFNGNSLGRAGCFYDGCHVSKWNGRWLGPLAEIPVEV